MAIRNEARSMRLLATVVLTAVSGVCLGAVEPPGGSQYKIRVVVRDFQESTEPGGHPDFPAQSIGSAGLPGTYVAGMVSQPLYPGVTPKPIFNVGATLDWYNVSSGALPGRGLDYAPDMSMGLVACGSAGAGDIRRRKTTPNFSEQVYTCGSQLNDVKIVDANIAYAVGLAGEVVKTTDSGDTWVSQSFGPDNHWAVDFADASIGYIASGAGAAFMTIDGGATWDPMFTGTAQTLRGVDFVDGKTGWMVGHGGTIIKTINGGGIWIQQASGTAVNLHDVHAHSATTAWAVGQSSTILVTTDGGTTWTPQPNGMGVAINSVVFSSDGMAGFVVGNLGSMHQTYDGGLTWTGSRVEGGEHITDIVYLPEVNEGWCATSAGWMKRHHHTGVLITQDWKFPGNLNEAREHYDPAQGDTAGSYNGFHNGFATSPVRMYEWFTDKLGVNMSTVHQMQFVWQPAGYYLYHNPAFYPIDDQLYGNTAGQVHNYDFTVAASLRFVYDASAAQYFSYYGNDECWVYVNGELKVDMGGAHAPTRQTVLMDRMGLVDGEEYPFHIFLAKRQRTNHLVQIVTNMYLWTDGTPNITGVVD